jgi:hypothetical protein
MSARSALRLRLRRVFYRKLIDRAEPGKKVGPGKGNRLNTKEARNAFDAHRHHKMVAMLANARSDADPQQIFATMQSEAIKAHQELDPELAKKIKIPKLVELPKPDVAENDIDCSRRLDDLRRLVEQKNCEHNHNKGGSD